MRNFFAGLSLRVKIFLRLVKRQVSWLAWPVLLKNIWQSFGRKRSSLADVLTNCLAAKIYDFVLFFRFEKKIEANFQDR